MNDTTPPTTNETPPVIELRFAHGNLSKSNPDSLGLLQAWINDGFKIVTESHSGEYLYIRLERDNRQSASAMAERLTAAQTQREWLRRKLQAVIDMFQAGATHEATIADIEWVVKMLDQFEKGEMP